MIEKINKLKTLVNDNAKKKLEEISKFYNEGNLQAVYENLHKISEIIWVQNIENEPAEEDEYFEKVFEFQGTETFKIFCDISSILNKEIEEYIKTELSKCDGYKLKATKEEILNFCMKEKEIADTIFDYCPPLLYKNIDELITGCPLSDIKLPLHSNKKGYELLSINDIVETFGENIHQKCQIYESLAVFSFERKDRNGWNWLTSRYYR